MAASKTFSSVEVIDVQEKPFQPTHLVFPRRVFGQTSHTYRSFKSTWFNSHKWLHYDVGKDAAFCFVCCKAVKAGKAKVSGSAEKSFLSTGFTNWQGATRAFKKHEESHFHKLCSSALATTMDVGDMLNAAAITEKENNRKYMLKVLSSIRFLARQGLALRGDGDEQDSNLIQLLMLRGEDYKPIWTYLGKQQLKYTSHEVQNELLSIMALQVLRSIASQIQAAVFFTVMLDEATDCANREQVVLVFRWVDEDLTPHEEFIGLYLTASITAAALLAIIEDTILRMNLKLQHCRGQCYDGASVMSGTRGGLAKLVADKEPRAIFTHCYGHALNLSVGDTIRQCQVMKSALDVVMEISKLIKKSPKRDAVFQRLKENLAPDCTGFRVLCPTRWTVRAASLKSVLDNYGVLQALWDEAQSWRLDSEMRARIIGVATQMQSFEFVFGVSLGNLLLHHTDNLSKSLQQSTLSAAEGQRLAKLTLEVLESLRRQDQFDTFFARVLIHQKEFDIDEPTVPRKRRIPGRFKVGTGEGHFHTTAADYYRQIYFEVLDHAVAAVKDRFDQPGYRIYQNLQELIIKACQGKDFISELDLVTETYGDDISCQQLHTQLLLLKPLFASHEGHLYMKDITQRLSELSIPERVAFSSVWVAMKLLLVMPATNATSERSFSALRRVKTYLRSTMSQERLNNLIVLHVHKEKTDNLDLKQVCQEFVSGREGRLRTFGNFL